MFKELRQNSPFFIFQKGEDTNLKTGSVISVSQPQIKPQTNFNPANYYQNEYYVDVQVKINDEIFNFNKLPSNSAIADFPSGNQKIVVSSNRDLIRNEIETTMSNSRSVIDSISKHENTIKACEKILQEINPTFAKEKEQEDEIKRLQLKVESMEKKLGGIDEIKQILLDSKQNNNTIKK